MRPKRYPYRQKGPTELTIDPKNIITNQISANDIASQSLVIKSKNSEITFSGTKIEFKARSTTDTDETAKLLYEIAKLRCEVAVNTSELNNIKRKLSSN
ncbi:hypothetical protein [Streptococcus parasuis]|uniref:hypothetical protein n=1 Tax=Streptococcus parasuis TaxID=1501662 RepID=UPI00370D8728